MRRKQFEIAITTQEDAIAALQAQLESGEFSRAARAELKREILNRVHFAVYRDAGFKGPGGRLICKSSDA
jgi:hypothetical protein